MDSITSNLRRHQWQELIGVMLLVVSFCASSHSLPQSHNSTQVQPTTNHLAHKPKPPPIGLHTILTLVMPYSIIFVLAVVGNLLVIITLSLNRSMRSVTNLFLLNLAIADLLLGVLCMPFTLVGVLLRRFIFGSFLCHAISYLQAVSVAVSVWTLVVMSVERYYAICQPLRSWERRQTRRHAYRTLTLVWTMALLLMSPTAVVSELQVIPQTGDFKCRETWPSFFYKQAFTIFLDLILLVIPLFMMIFTYAAIGAKLYHNLQNHVDCQLSGSLRVHKTTSSTAQKSLEERETTDSSVGPKSTLKNSSSTYDSLSLDGASKKSYLCIRVHRQKDSRSPKAHIKKLDSTLRVNPNNSATQGRQRRVIAMLIAVVVEFFVCWTPIFTMDTWALYQPTLIYRHFSQWLGFDIIATCHLLCFCSSCTNPITYCFMNRRFRRHFLAMFSLRSRLAATQTPLTPVPIRTNGIN